MLSKKKKKNQKSSLEVQLTFLKKWVLSSALTGCGKSSACFRRLMKALCFKAFDRLLSGWFVCIVFH